MAEVKPKRVRRKKGSKKAMRAFHNKEIGKYIRQARRTFQNKLRDWKRHFVLYPNDLQFRAIYNSLISREG